MTKRVFFVILQSKHGTRQLEDENEQTPLEINFASVYSQILYTFVHLQYVWFILHKNTATLSLSLSLRRLKTKSKVSRITIRKGS